MSQAGSGDPPEDPQDSEIERRETPPEVFEAIAKMGEGGPEALITIFQAMATYYSGPLPPPEMLVAYKEAGDDFPDRIVHAFEEQSSHRRALERSVVEGDNRRADRGQWMAYSLALLAIVGGIVLIAIGKEGFGFASILTAVAGLAGTFIVGRQREERERRARAAGTSLPRPPAQPPQQPSARD